MDNLHNNVSNGGGSFEHCDTFDDDYDMDFRLRNIEEDQVRIESGCRLANLM
jgi:hypothetical protein